VKFDPRESHQPSKGHQQLPSEPFSNRKESKARELEDWEETATPAHKRRIRLIGYI
jgi:hypothetical protein